MENNVGVSDFVGMTLGIEDSEGAAELEGTWEAVGTYVGKLDAVVGVIETWRLGIQVGSSVKNNGVEEGLFDKRC